MATLNELVLLLALGDTSLNFSRLLLSLSLKQEEEAAEIQARRHKMFHIFHFL